MDVASTNDVFTVVLEEWDWKFDLPFRGSGICSYL